MKLTRYPFFSNCMRTIPILLLGGMLVACSDSGPSISQAQKALKELQKKQVRQLGTLVGKNEHIQKIKVDDMNCNRDGERTFDCRVLLESRGHKGEARIEFTRLGGKWIASEK